MSDSALVDGARLRADLEALSRLGADPSGGEKPGTGTPAARTKQDLR
jgi:hypothetical protein